MNKNQIIQQLINKKRNIKNKLTNYWVIYKNLVIYNNNIVYYNYR
jgi:hypothetical protein